MTPMPALPLTRPRAARAGAGPQRGAVLFVSLIFLLILTLLGVMLARMQSSEERMAQNDSNHELAVEAAEAALRYAEASIGTVFPTTLFAANANGLYQLAPLNGSVYTPGYNWTAPGNAQTYSAALTSVSQQPMFIIESLPSPVPPGWSSGPCNYQTNCPMYYQVTTHASGGDQTGSATLRSIYLFP
jgi:type IV pilus assembly protein PilX